jgi:hypothetical protein
MGVSVLTVAGTPCELPGERPVQVLITGAVVLPVEEQRDAVPVGVRVGRETLREGRRRDGGSAQNSAVMMIPA